MDVLKKIVLTQVLWICLAAAASPSFGADGADTEVALEYIKLVQQHVDNHWSYKKTLDNQFYSIQATVTVNREGSVLDTVVDRVSKDETFNEEALRQLAAMEPFPRFPEAMQQDDFEIRLHLMPNAY